MLSKIRKIMYGGRILLVGFVSIIFQCDIRDADTTQPNIDCEAQCDKIINECGKDSEMQQCINNCDAIKKSYQKEFVEALDKCIIETPCGKEFDLDSCYVVNSNLCKASTALNSLIETLCNKKAQCEGWSEEERVNCKEEWSRDPEGLECMKEDTLTSFKNCVENKTCESDPFGTCIKEVIG